MSTAAKKPPNRRCIFVEHQESGEPAYYCGHTDDMPDLLRGIKNTTEGELSELLCGQEREATFRFYVADMTDEEIAALPEI